MWPKDAVGWAGLVLAIGGVVTLPTAFWNWATKPLRKDIKTMIEKVKDDLENESDDRITADLARDDRVKELAQSLHTMTGRVELMERQFLQEIRIISDRLSRMEGMIEAQSKGA